MDEFIESLYLLMLLLVMWGISFLIGMVLSDYLFMVIFFWISVVIIVSMYAYLYKKKNKDIFILRKQILISIPIWLFLVYQSYFTVRNTMMSSFERWALVPFVLGLGFYVALIKLNIEKKLSD